MKLECKSCGLAGTLVDNGQLSLVYCSNCEIYFQPMLTPVEEDKRTNDALKKENLELLAENTRLVEELEKALRQTGSQYRGSKIVYRAIERQKQESKLSKESSLPL